MSNLIGRHITATAPRRRVLRGVVLPPAPGSRSTKLRLALDDRPKPVTFDPTQWTITCGAGPLYRHGQLTEHLATRTMLKTELRREPAPGQKPIAEYQLRKGTAELFAVVDTVPMKELSPARAAAWTKSRTCERCGTVRPRPIPENDGAHNCSDCRKTIAFERWTEQSRRAQAEAAAWARGVLDDPAAVLVARAPGWDITRYRVESVLSGCLLVDERIRGIDDLHSITFSPPKTVEEFADWAAKYDGTINRHQLAELAPSLKESRLIGWHSQSATGSVGIGNIANTDVVSDRLALWSGVAPVNGAPYWFPEPRIPWSYYPPTFVPYTTHQGLDPENLAARISNLRTLLHLMAHSTPPEPSVHRPFGSS